MTASITERTDGQIEMVYAGETPWHGLGTKVDKEITAAAAESGWQNCSKIMGTNQQMVRTTSNSEVNMNTRTKQPYKHNRLIEHWLINHRVSTVFRSIADLAEWAERELRFTITEANMQLVLRSMGIKFTRDMSIREKQIMVDTAIHQTSQVQDWKTFVKA